MSDTEQTSSTETQTETQTEQGSQEKQTSQETQTAQTPVNFSSFVSEDGSLKEGWQDHFIPEEYRQLGEFNKIKNVKDLSRQLGYSVKLQGKKGVIVPGPGSDENVIREFRSAMGIPETGEGYQYKEVGDLNLVDMSTEAMKPVLERMNKANYTQEQVNEGLAIFHDFMAEMEAAVDAENEQAVKDAEAKIQKITGTAKDKMVHLANLAIDQITADWSEDYRRILFDPESGLINDPSHAELKPYLLHLLAHTGEKMAEHKLISPDEGTLGGMTMDEIDAKIAEIEATQGFFKPDDKGALMRDDGRRDQYNSLAKERDKLYRLRDRLQNRNKGS
jgi:hypothetical protein